LLFNYESPVSVSILNLTNSINEIKIGEITSGIFSPRLKKNIGLSMILKEYWDINNEIIVVTPDNIKRSGIITSIPFK